MVGSSISSQLLETAVSQSFNAIVITDADLQDGGPRIVFCNAAFCQLTGYRADELMGQSPRILQGAHTDARVIDRLRNCLESGEFFHGSTVNYRKDGQSYHVEWNISPVRDADGRISHYVSVQQDVSAKVEAVRQRDMLARAIHEMADPVMIADGNARILFVNHAFEQQTGYRQDDILGSVSSLLSADDGVGEAQSSLIQDLQHGKMLRRTVLQRRHNGDPYFSDQSVSALRDDSGRIRYYVSIGKDVSSQVKTQNMLKTLVNRDPLTGLFNRRYGEALLADCEAQAQGRGDVGIVLLCDIDFFKAINDGFGHAYGDEALKLAAQKMSALLRSSDVLVRWGGDEFLLLLPNTPVQAGAMLARTLCRAVAAAQEARAGGLTLSMGLAAWECGESSGSVLERADRALYQAKENGRNRAEIAERLAVL